MAIYYFRSMSTASTKCVNLESEQGVEVRACYPTLFSYFVIQSILMILYIFSYLNSGGLLSSIYSLVKLSLLICPLLVAWLALNPRRPPSSSPPPNPPNKIFLFFPFFFDSSSFFSFSDLYLSSAPGPPRILPKNHHK